MKMWKTALTFAIVGLLTAGAIGALAGTIPFFNPQQLQIPATGADLNALINQINSNAVIANGSALVVGTLPANFTGVNGITVTPGSTGGAPTLSSSGTDTNVGLWISTQSVTPGRGVVGFTNMFNWAAAPSLQLCPGDATGQTVVTEYLYVADWLGRVGRIPFCSLPGPQIQLN